MFPDRSFAALSSPVVKEKSYFAHMTSRDAYPAEVSNLRDGGVAPKGKIPQEFNLELFSHVPR
jgi:hypothetical protein